MLSVLQPVGILIPRWPHEAPRPLRSGRDTQAAIQDTTSNALLQRLQEPALLPGPGRLGFGNRFACQFDQRPANGDAK